MKYWLIKSEPEKYSWAQFNKDKKTFWDGVRNYAARNFMQQMEVGDLAFYYHSNEGKEIVGIAEVVKTAYQDPTTELPAWVVVDFKPKISFKSPVTLEQIKAEKKLEEMILVKNSRLSVQPVTKKEWDIILKMSEE